MSTDPTCTNLDLLAAEVTAAQRWGDYAAAIQRWEHVIGRPAPEPTQCNWDAFNTRKAKRLKSRLPVGMRGSITFMHKGPSPQLSARFTEWLMGVPDGWITDVPGVTRNEALKMCGNGVVPQQGAAALRWLLAQLEQHGV